MFRGALLVVFLAASVAGCGRREAASPTQLTLVALNASVGRAEFHLECAPTGGDLPQPSQACAALKADPRLVTRPTPFVCVGGTFSWWAVTISGRLNGRTIRRTFSTCWTAQMATIGRLGLSWNVLREHLLQRRRETVLAGTERFFAPGVLRATDLVTCDILGHHLEVGVPVEAGPRASEGWGGKNVVGVTLSVGRSRGGSVKATCR